MFVLHCVLFYILFRGALAGDFFITDYATDWINASKQCQLAEPDLIFSSTGVQLNVSEDIYEDVWVGYYQAGTAFEYFGCALKRNHTPTFNTKADPGQCMSACGAKKIIGIFSNECFCLDNDELEIDTQTMFPYCNKQCSSINGIVCGGQNDVFNSYMSLYRPIGTGNSVWIENDHRQYIYTDWADATISCFANNTRPTTYNNTHVVQTSKSTPPIWTGMVTSQVMYTYSDYQSHWKPKSTYMYGFLRGRKTRLKFTSYKTDIKKSLCLHGTTKSTSKSTTASSTTNKGVVTSPRSTSAANINTEQRHQSNNEGSSDVGAIVGATISFFVVIAIVIVLVLFFRKRGLHLPCGNEEKQTSPRMNQNVHVYENSQPAENGHSSHDTTRVEYADINDINVTMAENDAQNDVLNKDRESTADYANNYFTIDKKNCDSSNPGNPSSNQNQTYEKLNFEECTNYVNYSN